MSSSKSLLLVDVTVNQLQSHVPAECCWEKRLNFVINWRVLMENPLPKLYPLVFGSFSTMSFLNLGGRHRISQSIATFHLLSLHTVLFLFSSEEKNLQSLVSWTVFKCKWETSNIAKYCNLTFIFLAYCIIFIFIWRKKSPKFYVLRRV